MTSRPARIATAIALSSVSLSLTAASCASQQFTSNDSNPGDAGTAGSSNPPFSSAGANGEGGSANASNDAGAPNATGGTSPTNTAGEGGAAGNDSHSSAGGSSAAGGSENDAGSSGTSATGNEAGHGGSPALPDCDPRWFPVEESCVIDEQYGVFVSPLGSDTDGNGSRETPFATIARGVASAITNSRRVYACADEGAYRESVSIDLADGLELYGGFSCSDWSYDTKLKSVVASGSTRALHVSEVSRLRFEDFRFEAVDATTPGESSIAAWVVDSSEVVFVRSAIQAGRGASGSHGGLVPFTYPLESAFAGNAATGGATGTPGAEKRCVCQTEELVSTGGAGGPTDTRTGAAGLPDYGGGAPGSTSQNLCFTKGGERVGDGGNGRSAPHTAAVSGATTLGFADLSGWHPTPGSNGKVGAPGQGGGGGASLTLDANDPPGTVSRGGSGGCGSCGGNGGGGGRGGGASIALLVLNADVALSTSLLITSDGGDGGNGHVGQEGQQTVGVGGAGVEACRGGNGGKGARGGAGGGGAGGISVGIVWSGPDAPVQLETTVETGTPGVGGLGAELDVNDGIDGVAAATLEVN